MSKNKRHAKVALIYPPYQNSKNILFSLSYLVDGLRKENLLAQFKVFDCPAKKLSLEALYIELEKYQPEIIGISIPFTLMLSSALKITRECRKIFPKAWIVIGGAHATLCPEDLVKECDYVVMGDGKYPMVQIINSFLAKQKKFDINGTAYFKNGDMVILPKLKIDPEKRKMGSPAWDDIDLKQFFTPIIYGDQRKGFPVFTSIGCPFSCSYCSNHILSNRNVINRDLNDVVSEIQEMQNKYKLELFSIEDEVFTLNEDRVVEFCDMIERKQLQINWTLQTRPNLIPDEEILSKMYKAGARVISLGIESGNSEILKINKGISLEQVSNAVDKIKQAGFLVYAGFIIGFPQDTIDTVWDTIKFPDELGIDSPGFQIMVPYPKTKVREVAEKEGGIIINDFAQYTTYGAVYVPPGLAGYDLLKIRKFAYQYFHTRSKERVSKWLKRFVNLPNYDQIQRKYNQMYEQRKSYNKEYLMSLKYSIKSKDKQDVERLPI